MAATSTGLSFHLLQWLFPIAATVHNIEEAIWMPGFMATHGTELPWSVDPGQFRFALVVLTAAAWMITFLGWRTGPQSIWTYLECGYIVTMLINVFVPHIPAAILFHGYAPGVVTTVLVNLPAMALLTRLAIKDEYISGRKAVAFRNWSATWDRCVGPGVVRIGAVAVTGSISPACGGSVRFLVAWSDTMTA
jgi:hypothetical protein